MSQDGIDTAMRMPIGPSWLCIDTCGPYLCVALGSAAAFESIVQPGQNRSSIDLVPAIQKLLSAAKRDKPDAIAVTVGPGSFTGARIGVSTARNLGMLWNIPVRPFYSLQLYAESIRNKAPLLVCLDGKQNKFYSLLIRKPEQVYETREADLQDLTPAQIASTISLDIDIFCDAPELLKERLPEARPVLSLPQPDPESFFRLLDRSAGQALSYNSIIPVYVRSDPATAKYPDGFQHKPES